MNSKPELAVRCQHPRVPGFNAELKTMGDRGLFDGAGTYVALDMLRSFFTRWDVGQASPTCYVKHRFYTRPPLGYALCGAPPLGWIVAVEWIGRLFVSAYSQPFFLGSDQHDQAIRHLERPAFDEPIDLTSDLLNTAIWKFSEAGPQSSPAIQRKSVFWTIAPASNNSFYKVKTWNAIDPALQKRAALAYAAYGRARAAACNPPPASLVEARLLFGCGVLAVHMPFLAGRNPGSDELVKAAASSPLAQGLAVALVWLAQHDLLYTDLRPPNVVIAGGAGAGGGGTDADGGALRSAQNSPRDSAAPADPEAVYLVDYDDMRVVPGLGVDLLANGVQAFANAFSRAVGGVMCETDFSQYEGVWAAVGELAVLPPAKRVCTSAPPLCAGQPRAGFAP